MAIEAAQSTDPVAVRDSIASTLSYMGATFISHFDEQRHAVKGVGIMKIENGQVHPYRFDSIRILLTGVGDTTRLTGDGATSDVTDRLKN